MNRTKMVLLEKNKKIQCGYYVGQIDQSVYCVIQALPECSTVSVTNDIGQIAACIFAENLKDQKIKAKAIRWFEYYPYKYFKKTNNEFAEVAFKETNENGEYFGSPSWLGVSDEFKSELIDVIVEPAPY